MSLNLVLYGVSFVVHSSLGMVSMIIVFDFLVLQVGPNVWLYVRFQCCVGVHIQYFAICMSRPSL